MASGSQLTKVDKGFQELGKLGLVEPTPYRVFGAQATGCSPVSKAFAEGHDVVQPVRPDTIARSLAIGNPADGPYVLDAVRRTGGAVADVSDEEVVEGIRLLARTEGVFAETAGGVTVATAKKLIEAGQLDPDAETVLLITGDGLKTLDAISGQVGPTATVPASSKAVREALAARGLTGAAAPEENPAECPAAGRGQRVAARDHVQPAPVAARAAGHGDVARAVRPPHGRTRALQPPEHCRVRMVVVVPRTHADQHGPRRDGGEELRRAVAAAVVRHLQDVRMQRHARGEQLCLGGHLDVPGEQHGADRRRRAEHRRAVVDLRAVVRVDVVGRMLRAEHVQGEGGPHEPDPGSHLHDPHARRRPTAAGSGRAPTVARGRGRPPPRRPTGHATPRRGRPHGPRAGG